MEGINTMPRDEYYRRLGVAIGKVGQRLLRKGDEYGSLSRKHENLGHDEEAMDAFFMDIAYQTAHYGMIKRFEKIRNKENAKPLFTLTPEEVEITEVVFNRFILDREDLKKFIKENPKEFEMINNIIHRIKQWQQNSDNSNS